MFIKKGFLKLTGHNDITLNPGSKGVEVHSLYSHPVLQQQIKMCCLKARQKRKSGLCRPVELEAKYFNLLSNAGGGKISMQCSSVGLCSK